MRRRDTRVLADQLASEPDPYVALHRYDDIRRPPATEVVLANRANPPDAILREVYERTGDQPFDDIDTVISQSELAALSEQYKRVAGFDQARLKPI